MAKAGEALRTLKEFLSADLVERDVHKALSFLSGNICWYGTSDQEDVCGLEEAKRYIENEIRISPSPYQIEYLSENDQTKADGYGAALVKCRIDGGGASLQCRCSASVCWEDGAVKIYALHMSVPDTFQKEGEFFPFSLAEQYEKELHEEFLDELVDGAILGRYCEPSNEIYIVNRQLLDFLGYPNEEVFRRELNNCAFNTIFPEDRDLGRVDIEEQLRKSNRYRIEYRILRRDGSWAWVESHGKKVTTKEGRKALVGIINDITARKNAELLAQTQYREIRNLYDTIPGGVFICKFNPDWDVTFANNGFYTFLGYTREEFSSLFHDKMIGVIHKEDRAPMVPLLEAQLAHGNYIENTNRLVCKGGVVKWISIHAVLSGGTDGGPHFYCTFVDITPQKEAEQKLLDSEQRYRIAVEGADINIWEYDIPGHKIVLPESVREKLGEDLISDGCPDAMMKRLGISPEQAKGLRELFQRMEQGEPKVSMDYWRDSPVTHTRRCEHVTYSVAFDDRGKPVKAYGASIDVTQSKFDEKRYQEELAYRDSVTDSTVATCRINLTKRIVESMRIKGSAQEAETYRNLVDFRDRTLLFCCENEMTEQQNQRLSPDALIRSYNEGVTAISEEFLARFNETHYCWMRTDVNLVKRPETGELLAFFYSRDLTDNLIRTNVLDTVLTKDYEEAGVVDLRTGIYKKITDGTSFTPEEWECDYKTFVGLFCKNCVSESERTRLKKLLQIERIKQEIKKNSACDIRYLGLTARLEPQYSLIRFQYLNNNQNMLLITRQNVDEFVRREQKKQRELERANEVKSEFLSRMSHEIRTPLNAIIGLAELGKESLLQPVPSREEGLDYVEKTLDASHYLLSLINDILDMSKIESGEIKLACQPMDCQRFINGVRTIIETQAAAKGIAFTINNRMTCSPQVLGDATRVEQVLINLLNNAVKFTPKGGQVRLDIDTLNQNDAMIAIRFVVSDTGVGISKEFMPRIFQPFSQEYAGITSAYGGSGLGLSIARRLTRLMGGDLTAKSQKDKGSVFTAIMKFSISDQVGEDDTVRPTQTKAYHLENKRFLLCEDYPLNTMVVKRILERQGCIIDCAENGEQGLTMFRQSAPGFYQAILMDIRMPVMDGLSASRLIRTSDHPDAQSIPIIAMTANAYEEDIRLSREAGMNAHLSKPIEPELLFETLSEQMDNQLKKTDH